MEPQGILGVIDDMSNLFFVKSNGEEIARISRSQLKLFAPVLDLIVLDDLNSRKSSWGDFYFFTNDGLLHQVELTREPTAEIYAFPTSKNIAEKMQYPNNVSCLDFYPDLSLVILVSASSASTNSGNNAVEPMQNDLHVVLFGLKILLS